MMQSLGIVEALERVGRRLQQHYANEPIPRAEIEQQVAAECGCARHSVLPSDHCYNRANDGIAWRNVAEWAPMFEHVGGERSGLYKFLGRNHPYTGTLLHYPRDGPPRQVGQWVAGELRYTGDESAEGDSANAGGRR